ncbi:MAG: hypothetical protein PHW32_01800 [Bacilli bacterium]|nr:hypothetical protein [Bacilli bacterium]MDD4282314.1 hypothetical protein [Bacilli bacterium]MDD4718318.1 hypothetical protein [Bacilli bacterium]
MKKELPKVFANKIDKALTNNERVSYGINEKGGPLENKSSNPIIEKKSMNVNQKIDAIFNSPGYIYKADVNIKFKTGTVSKQIIGKNNTHIITINNELIPIEDIIDIDFAN